jgi:protein-tyrosine phosphatase
MTIAMCQMAKEDGTVHMVCSPHANFEYTYNRERCTQMVEELRARVPGMAFSLGCDFHLSFENIEDAVAFPKRYTIGDSRYLLIEFSDFTIPANTPEILFKLQSAGMVPIITHPERNPVLSRKSSLVNEFVEQGALVQITANSLTGFWGRGPKKVTEQLLEKGLVHFIASDAHSLKSRPPHLSAARKTAAKIVGQRSADRLVIDNPQAVVNDQPLP